MALLAVEARLPAASHSGATKAGTYVFSTFTKALFVFSDRSNGKDA
jgi:hypothetical protein